jgi:hypothetical protein
MAEGTFLEYVAGQMRRAAKEPAQFPSLSPVPRWEIRSGRVYHAPECYGDDEHPDFCVCGLDDALEEVRREAGA